MPAGFALWNWFANNKYAQIGAAIVGALLLMRWKEEVDEARGARRAKERAEKATRKAADKTLKKMEQDNEDTIESAREARSNVPDDVRSDSLRDDYASILFGDD